VNKFLLFAIIFSLNSYAENLVFVGSPFSVVESENSCEEYVESGICMDVAFELKYDVLEWFDGGDKEEKMEFIGFTHYEGLPHYTSYQYALVFVKKVKGNYVLNDIKPVVELGDDYNICVKERTKIKSECSDIRTVRAYLSLL
jgi:hypothetical protein